MIRRHVIPAVVAGVLASGCGALVAVRLHSTHWSQHRSDLAHNAAAPAAAEEAGTRAPEAWPPLQPDPWNAALYGAQQGLVFFAVALLAVALVITGYRAWGLAVPVMTSPALLAVVAGMRTSAAPHIAASTALRRSGVVAAAVLGCWMVTGSFGVGSDRSVDAGTAVVVVISTGLLVAA